MPGFDGTGPEGIGPSGGLRGFCGGYRGRPLRRRVRRMIHPDYPVRQFAPPEGAYPEFTREERIHDLTYRAEMITGELENIQAAIEQLKDKRQQDNES